MNISAMVMMGIGCFIVWGGLVVAIGISLKKEKRG